MPRLLSLDNVGFGDGGFDINVQALINQGYRAGIDFGYPYGALSLFYSKLWFSLLGLGPRAFCAGLLASDVIFALAMARFIWLIRVKACGITLGLIGAVLGVMGAFTLAHGLERACLSWALAEQIDSRRPRALALAAVAVLAKPSMGFVYGAWLIVLILCELRREACLTGARLAREFGPAPLAGGVLAAGLSLIYGPPVVAHLLLPLTGAKAYQLNGFGFLGRTGRTFWYFPGVHLAYYFGTPVAFWFTATLYLFVGADVAERHLMGPSGRDDASDETVITCALCIWLSYHCFSDRMRRGRTTYMCWSWVRRLSVAGRDVSKPSHGVWCYSDSPDKRAWLPVTLNVGRIRRRCQRLLACGRRRGSVMNGGGC
jgi:hypothetical protein